MPGLSWSMEALLYTKGGPPTDVIGIIAAFGFDIRGKIQGGRIIVLLRPC